MTEPFLGEARETSGATTGGLLRYVRTVAGDEAVAQVLARAGVPYTADQLEDQALLVELRHPDPAVRGRHRGRSATRGSMFQVGAAALQTGLAHSIVILLRAMGTPRQVFRQLPRAVAKFSTTSTMEIVESGATSATIRFTLHPGLRALPAGLHLRPGPAHAPCPRSSACPPAEIEHDECESDGDPACIYRLTWDRRSRLPGRRRDGRADGPGARRRCAASCASCSRRPTELVGSDDVDTALERIVARAAEAVLAPAYLLAVEAPGGGAPLVHSAGLPSRRGARTGAALLAGERPRARTRSSSTSPPPAARTAGSPRSTAPATARWATRRPMLAAYAGHAAAALDLLIALEEARQEAERAERAARPRPRALRRRPTPPPSPRSSAEALPRIVGCTSAGILLWDSASGSLQSHVVRRADRRGAPTLLRTTDAARRGRAGAGGHAHRPGAADHHERDQQPGAAGACCAASARADVVAVPLLAGTHLPRRRHGRLGEPARRRPRWTATCSPGSAVSATRRRRRCRRPGCWRPCATRPPTTR